MLWRSKAAPRSLTALADAAGASCDVASRYFAAPSPALAQQAARARQSADRARLKFDEAVKKQAPPRTDWLDAAAALAEAADAAARAAEEADRFGADLGSVGLRLAAGLAAATRRLREALPVFGGARASRLLIEAKNEALRIEEMRRKGRQAALERPVLPDELKLQAVLDHFSRGAEAVQRAADALTARLAHKS